MLNAYIYDGLRTPFGRHAGSLAKIRPDDLAAHVIKALVQKHNLPADIFKGLVSFSLKGSTMYAFSIMSGVLSPNTGVSSIPYANSTPANIINIAKIF